MNIESYYKKHMNKIVFINIKEEIFQQKWEISFLKGIPIPVSLDQVSKDSKDKKKAGTISSVASAEAMLYVIGADYNFPHAESYMRFLRISTKDIGMFTALSGVKMAEAGQYIEAAILFRAAEKIDTWLKQKELEENPLRNIKLSQTSPDIMYNYARACRDVFNESEDTEMKNDFREESVKTFERIIKEFPDFADSYYYLGYFYMNKKRYTEAAELWGKFITLTKDELLKTEIQERMVQLEDLMIYEKGYLEVLNGKCEEGLAILLPLYDTYKEWWNLMFFIGLAYRKTGEVEKAIDFFKEVVRLRPSQGDALNELGLCYAALTDFENAEKYLKKATLVEENDPEILCNLAAVYINWGKLKEAEGYLFRAEELSPDEEICKIWRVELERCKILAGD